MDRQRAKEIERLKWRSLELRERLQAMNPNTDDTYDEIFTELITVDRELKGLGR